MISGRNDRLTDHGYPARRARRSRISFVWKGPVDKTVRLCDAHLPGKWEWFFTGVTLFNVGFGWMWRRRIK